ncbi:hypothetical protein DCC79_07205, partial [bacterium]
MYTPGMIRTPIILAIRSLSRPQLVRDDLPAGASLRDLGLHRLKDLRHSEQIFQVVAAGAPDIATPPDTAEKLPERAGSIADVDLLPAECPYRGLAAFREADARFFFGREAFTALLVDAVASAPMAGVIGPSGSGKSSVVFAGLVPRLRGNGGKGGAGERSLGAWKVVDLRPGSRPYHALAGALLRGVPPAEAEQWAGERGGELAAGETALIRESAASRDRRAATEKARQAQKQALERRAHRLTRAVALLAVAGMLGGLGLAWYAISKRVQSDADALDARRTALIARSQQLLTEKRGDEALAAALEAVLLPNPTTDAELALSEAAYAPGARWEVAGYDLEPGTVALSPDERLVAVGDKRGSVRLLDAATGRLIRTLGKHATFVIDLCFSPDGTRLAAAYEFGGDASSETNLEIWPVDGWGDPLRIRDHDARIQRVSFAPDGRELITGGDDGSVRLWDVDSGEEIRRVADLGEDIQDLTVDPAGRFAVVGTFEGALARIDLATGAVTTLADLGVNVTRVALGPDGARVAATTTFPRSQVVLVDLDPPFRARPLPSDGQIPTSVAFLPDGQRILVGFNGSRLEVIDVETNAQVTSLVGHRDNVGAAVIDRAGRNAHVVDSNGTLRAWSLYGAAVVRRIVATYGSKADGVTERSFRFGAEAARAAGGRSWERRLPAGK